MRNHFLKYGMMSRTRNLEADYLKAGRRSIFVKTAAKVLGFGPIKDYQLVLGDLNFKLMSCCIIEL